MSEKKKIYTGYFAKLKVYQEANLTPIGVAGQSPEYYKEQEFKKLAPKYSFFIDYKNNKIDEKEYTRLYYKLVLNQLNCKEIILKLASMMKPESDGIILLCWETPEKFCHRHLIGDWITENTKIPVSEFNI